MIKLKRKKASFGHLSPNAEACGGIWCLCSRREAGLGCCGWRLELGLWIYSSRIGSPLPDRLKCSL